MATRRGQGGGAARRRKGTIIEGSLPTFDPAPSARFAARALSEARVAGALIGRLAVWAWLEDPSEHEFTKDLHIAVERAGLPAIRAWLAHEGLRTRELGIGGVNVRYGDQGVNVDFIDRTSEEHGDLGPLFGEAIAAAKRAGARVKVGTAKLPVAPPEYLGAPGIGRLSLIMRRIGHPDAPPRKKYES